MKRPLGVSLIAALQFLKAGFLLLVAAAELGYPGAQTTSKTLVALTYIAAHGTQPQSILLPFVAIFPAVIGWCLWHLKNWARWVLLTSSGVMVTRWLEALLIRDWALGETTLHTPLARKTVWTLTLLDGVIFVYLIQSEVKEAFNEVQVNYPEA